MTDKYIIVRVRNAEDEMPPNVVVVRGKIVMPTTPIAHIRKAIHRVAEEQFLSEADIVTHTRYMTESESETIKRIFETALQRAKEGRSRYDF